MRRLDASLVLASATMAIAMVVFGVSNQTNNITSSPEVNIDFHD